MGEKERDSEFEFGPKIIDAETGEPGTPTGSYRDDGGNEWEYWEIDGDDRLEITVLGTPLPEDD